MRCPNCSFINPNDAQFCENCGQLLEHTCPNCSHPVSPTAKFCKNCGFNLENSRTTVRATPARKTESLDALRLAAPLNVKTKVLAAREKLAGEHKLVTALFTDIVGSTTLAENMDPEDWREVVTGAHHRVGEAVYRYEGTIAQLLGDGVLAFFGAPITHEDDSERALRAALDILDSIQKYAETLRANGRVQNLEMRVGINTGLVVVGQIGHDMHMEYTAVGDTINTAARMQSAAEPNTILISENTHRFVKSLFSFEDKGKISIKGKAEPIQVYRALSERADAVRVRGIEGLSSPIVGRDRELAILQECAAELIRGRGQIVSIIGEAGLGKSRLAAEFQHRFTAQRLEQVPADGSGIKNDTPAPRWLEGRSLSFQTSVPYAPFVDMFTRYFELRSTRTASGAFEQMRTRIASVAPKHSTTFATFFATMLDIELPTVYAEQVRYLEPPLLRERIFSTVIQFFEILCGIAPVILQFEDLHWADATSLDLIERLLSLTARVPLLLLALYRPQRQDSAWRFHESVERDFSDRFVPVFLEPLDEAHSRELVGNLLYIEDLPEKVRALILKKAEGNPFFVEEVIRSLLDVKLVVRENDHWRATREIDKVAVPDTLAGVISARLDRLDEEAKYVAQTAAVVGREFMFDVLSDIYDIPAALDPALGTLERRELIREKSRLPKRNYSFKHALTQETAYASLLMSKRRELHRRVAECMVRLAPERVNEIARHFLEAQDYSAALPYLIDAGNRAIRAFSAPEAMSFFTQALEIAKTQTDLTFTRRAFEGVGNLQRLAFNIEGATRTYREMLEFAELRGDTAMQVSAINKLAFVIGLMTGEFPQAEEFLSKAEAIARQVGDKTGLAEMFTIRCQLCTAQADFDGTVHYMNEIVSIGQELEAKEQLAYGLSHLASAYANMAEYDKAFETGEEAWKHANELNARQHQAELHVLVNSTFHISKGDLDAALASARAGIDIAERIGYVMGEPWGRLITAKIARSRGEFEIAIAEARRGIEVARPLAIAFMYSQPLATLAATYVDISPELASLFDSQIAEALSLTDTPMGMPGGAWVRAELGFAELALGNVGLASELFHKGLRMPSVHRITNRPILLAGAARVALLENQIGSARDYLQQARDFLDKHKTRFPLPLVDFTEAQISVAEGNQQRASRLLDRAEKLASEMKLRPLLVEILLARKDRAGASRVVEEIKSMFKDKTLRNAYDKSMNRKLEGKE